MQGKDAAYAPIGAFDSGYGGLTVLRDIARVMPYENTIFIGDSVYFPYGPKPQRDVRSRVMKICEYLVDVGCKLIIIACNTATAAGLKDAQREFNVPIIGVIEPGSRAAAYATHSRNVGVIATEGTINSGAYVDAIHNLDAGIDVFQAATPALVDIAENGIQFDSTGACTTVEEIKEVKRLMQPLRDANIDTLVLGCTHFPLVADIVSACIGEDVTLVSSAKETALEVRSILERRKTARGDFEGIDDPDVTRKFLTTSDDVEGFKRFALRVLGDGIADTNIKFAHVDI